MRSFLLSSQDLPAGTSLAAKMTGDQSKLVHQAKEQEREKLREKVIGTYHRGNQENKCPFASTRNKGTSLAIGYTDEVKRAAMRNELA